MVYLLPQRVTGAGIFNTTGNGNLQDFTSYHINFLDFENLVISVISNKISGGAYEIWQQLVTLGHPLATETEN